MQEKLTEISSLKFRRIFPWIQLFRVFGIAIDIRKICLAAVGLMTLTCGNQLMSYFPFAPDEKPPSPWETDLGYDMGSTGSTNILKSAGGILDQPASTISRALTNWSLILRPVKDLIEPAIVLFHAKRGENPWSEVAYAWTRLLWGLCVWSIFGGAICRMAAVQFARDERIGMQAALAFAGKRFLSYLSAPLLPLAGIGALWLICLLGGFVGRIEFVGGIVVSVAFIFPLLFGFIMMLMVIGVAGGWPLMFATISVEGSDGFDGLSRSYSYIYDRPWYYAWLIVLTMMYSSVAIFFVWFATALMVHLAIWSITTGMGPDRTAAILHAVPTLFGGSSVVDADAAVSYEGSAIVGYWLYAVSLLLVGFVYSFFWTSATVIYFLLRHSDDAIELDEVYLPPEKARDELLAMITDDDSDSRVAPDAADGEQAAEAEDPPESKPKGDEDQEVTDNSSKSEDGPS